MTMSSLIIFAAIAVFTIGSAVALFILRKLFHAVIALTLAFIGCSFVLLYLHETLLALILLLIFVGGISTYLIVAVATEEKRTKIISIPLLVLLTLLFTGGTLLFIYQSLQVQYQPASVDIEQMITSAFQAQYLLLYFMVLLLFSTTIGGTLVMKRFVKLLIR